MKRVVGICALGVATAVSACTRASAGAAERKPDAKTVAVAPVTRGDVTQALTIGAEFRANQEIDVHAKVAGYLQSITVDVGDHVKEGQLLALLEVPELQNEAQQDEAAITRAAEDVNRAQADLDRAGAAHDASHLAAARLAAVDKTRPKLIAQQDLDEVASRDRQAEAQVATAKASVAAARGQLEYARANGRKTQTLLNYTRISAPFSGVITRRYADHGAMIQAGTSSQTQTMPIVRLSEVDTLRLVLAVPESAVPSIRLKTPVTVAVPAIGRTFAGAVARFADRLDPDTRTMPVEVDVPNPSGELMPGMNAAATIALREARDVLTVPVEAIDRGGGRGSLVVVTRDGVIEPRTVTVGLESASRVEVSGPIAAGDLVVIGARDQLKRGTAVTPKIVSPATQGEK
ncbi:MAG TPA: efflux RND transporter periplasmic adaptor subunit [Vicinamibacterales bacterium]|jgi:RND family efflux transporter MFP subunit